MKTIAHYLLATASPLQYLIDKPSVTHDLEIAAALDCTFDALFTLTENGEKV